MLLQLTTRWLLVFNVLNKVIANKIVHNEYYDKAMTILDTQIKDEDPFIEKNRNFNMDTNLFIPIDYSEAVEEQLNELFWTEQATQWQKDAYELLTKASELDNHTESTYLLSQIHLWSHYGIPTNKTLAFRYLTKFNELTGYSNSTALFELGVAHATGLFGAIPVDNSKALMYYQKAATLGDLRAKQVLAYRYAQGINVAKDCDTSLIIYRELADEIRALYPKEEWEISMPCMETYNIRLPDFNEGLLGDGLNSMRSSTDRLDSERSDLSSPLFYNVNDGHFVMQISFGSTTIGSENEDPDDRIMNIYYTVWDRYKGSYDRKRDPVQAKKLLEMVYEEFEQDVPFMDNLQKFFYSKCIYLLGHIYFTGDGTQSKDIEKARFYLLKSIDLIESTSVVKSKANIDMALISQFYDKNVTAAVEYYKKILETGSNDGSADYQLSKLAMGNPGLNIGNAYNLMQKAYRRSYIPGVYEYAKMTEESANDHFSCQDTAYLFKKFVELSEVHSAPQLKKAFAALLLGQPEVALWAYAQAAEQGFEEAQVSASYLLYQNQMMLDEAPITSEERKNLAVSYYNRAFKQNNLDAGVVSGDISYKTGDYLKALVSYQNAALKFSPQAIWNLGYMHEQGLGVEKNYQKAAKYYNEVLKYAPDLNLAVKCSLLKLSVKNWLAWWANDPVASIWDNKKSEKPEIAFKNDNFYKRLIQAMKKSFKENGGNMVTRNSDRSSQSESDANEHWIETFINYIEGLGLELEDVVSLGFALAILLAGIVFRMLANAGDWNIRVNGFEIRPQNQAQNQNQNRQGQQNQQGAFMNVQFFAV